MELSRFNNQKMSKTAFINSVSAVLLHLLLLVSPSTAEIQVIELTSDSRSLIRFEKFGFTNPGRLDISLPSVSVVAPSQQANLLRLGFFLTREESSEVVPQQNNNLCILDSADIFPLFTFLDLPHPPIIFSHSYNINTSNEYNLFFANCVPYASLTITLQTEFYNLNSDGSRNYLSSNQTHLPSLYFLFSLAYFAYFLAFILYLRHVNKHSLNEHSPLLLALLLLKALCLLLAALKMHDVKVSGTSDLWNVLLFMIDPIRVVLLFTLVVWVGIKWTFLHPNVGHTVLILVIVLQYIARGIYSAIDDCAPYSDDCIYMNQIFLRLNFISWCAIVFLIAWSMRSSLRKITQDRPAMNLLLCKFSRILFFYLIVIGYLIFTPFGVFALKTIVAYNQEWVTNLVEETGNLVFCIIIMFYVLGDPDKNEYCSRKEPEAEIALSMNENMHQVELSN